MRKCRVCGVLEGQWFQRRSDGSTEWRPCEGPVFGGREWFPGQQTQVRNGLCTGKVCQEQAAKEKRHV